MKLKVFSLLALLAMFLANCMPTQPEYGQKGTTPRSRSNPSPRGCTIFTVSTLTATTTGSIRAARRVMARSILGFQKTSSRASMRRAWPTTPMDYPWHL